MFHASKIALNYTPKPGKAGTLSAQTSFLVLVIQFLANFNFTIYDFSGISIANAYLATGFNPICNPELHNHQTGQRAGLTMFHAP